MQILRRLFIAAINIAYYYSFKKIFSKNLNFKNIK